MLKYLLSIFLGLFFLSSYGSPRVPSSYEFAGIQLSITEAARRQIQEDVDALHRSQTYFNRKVEKVDLFFPIIERVFREEGIPDDFKYLTIQESALISDAVSSSNAVGFWQFKKASATEVGLRVDNYIDERMHITASSRGAAKYLKKNNFFFDNWVYALLAYNTGPGGAEAHVDKKYFGKTKMEINKRTHWYVKKFLAHKIAFENEIHKNHAPALRLFEYDKTQNKSLKDLSDFFEIDSKEMADYNKWLRRGKIPSDKIYLAIIPIGTNDLVAQNLTSTTEEKPVIVEKEKSKIIFQPIYKPVAEFNFEKNQEYPKTNSNTTSSKIKINGIPGFIASSTDNLNSVLIQYSLSEKKFLKYNDLTSSSKIIGGQVYYLKSKKSKAKIHYHVVIAGENAWSISQKYGITVKSLLTKNRMREEKDLSAGMVVWLRFIRPSDVPVEYKKTNAQNVIVKSIPNQINYPLQNSATVSEPSSNLKDEPVEEIQSEEEFLFDEVNDETEFINENSYVDLKHEPEDPQTNLAASETKTILPEVSNNVKKEEIYHIVKSSETLFSISRTYGVTIGEIRQWNDIDDLDVLAIGQRILIKKAIGYQPDDEATVLSIQTQTYRVKADDTLYGIARKNNITIKELMELNNKTDFVIKEGETLKIRVTQ